MGTCLPCLSGTNDDYEPCEQPDPEERRKQQAQAAERRQIEQEGRGVKDPEALKRKQKQREAAEQKAEQQPEGGGLRWQVG